MKCGRPPFCNEDVNKMYQMISFSDLRFPSKSEISVDLKDLINKLLNKDARLRLGSKSGFNEIRLHPFFKNIDFESLIKKAMKAPFIPMIENQFDVQNFDKEFTGENPDAKSVIPSKNIEMIKRNQDKFKDFK